MSVYCLSVCEACIVAKRYASTGKLAEQINKVYGCPACSGIKFVRAPKTIHIPLKWGNWLYPNICIANLMVRQFIASDSCSSFLFSLRATAVLCSAPLYGTLVVRLWVTDVPWLTGRS